MKKWLLALMVCLSFASLTAGLILLPQTINAVYHREEEEQKNNNEQTEDAATTTYFSINLNGGTGYFGTDYNEFDQSTAYIDNETYVNGSKSFYMSSWGYLYYRSVSRSGASGSPSWSYSGCTRDYNFSFRNFIFRFKINSGATSVSVTATWTITTYTVTYDYNGGSLNGSSSTTQTVYKDSSYGSYSTPPQPTRAGYTLKGWSVNLATTINYSASSATRWESGALSVTPGHYYTLAAMWYNGRKYVSLKTRGFIVNGSDVKTGKYEVASGVYSIKAYVDVSSSTSASELLSKLSVTIRHMDSSGNIEYIPVSQIASKTIIVNRSHTLIANWSTGENPYSIILNAGTHAGSATAVSNVQYNGTVPSLPTPSVDAGYAFSGWYTSSSGGSRISAGTTFNEYAISGSWDHSNHTLTLYSQASEAYYTITLDKNGGTGGSSSVYARYLSSSLYSDTSGTTTTPSAPSYTGYTFGGWTTSGGTLVISSSGALQASVSGYTNSSKQWTKTDGATLKAKWTAKKYAITLNVNGATSGSNKTIYAQYNSSSLYANGTQGDTSVASITNPTRTNYSFKGWSTSSSLGSGTIVINTGKNLVESTEYTNGAKNWTKDASDTITLYACWEPVSRTVKVNLRKVTTTGSASSGWDNATPFYVNYTKATATSTSVENTSSTVNANYEAWQDSVMTFQATFNNAIFLGVTASDSAPTAAPHTMGVSTYTVGTGSTQNIYLWMQEISTPLRLANDERGWWWYLEDGKFPQSYVGDSLNNTLNSAGLTSSTTYDFGAGQTINVYTYSGSQYAKVAGNGTTVKLNGGSTQTFASGTNYWFKVEPIKWRVSKFYADYSTAIAAYPNISYSNVYGVSDMLGYGYMTTDSTAAGTAVSSFAGATLSYAGLGFGDTSTMSIGNEKYKADGSSLKVEWQTRDASQINTLNVADAYSTISGALKDVTYTKYSTQNPSAGTFDCKFYASDLSAMMMGMNYDNARAWTTDLYNLGSGYTILSSGSMQTSYLNENYGYIFAHKVAMASNCGMEYKAMNYIQSSGSQWFDSGVSIAANTWVETDLMFTNAWSYNMMFGAWSYFAVSLRSANTVCAGCGGSESQNIGSTTAINTKYRLQFGAGYGYTQNGVKTNLGGNSNTATSLHILMFAASAGSNSPYSWGGYGQGRIYTFKIYNGSTLVRDFVPVQNLKTGEYGMFDKVNHVFYGNAGSGAFTAG